MALPARKYLGLNPLTGNVSRLNHGFQIVSKMLMQSGILIGFEEVFSSIIFPQQCDLWAHPNFPSSGCQAKCAPQGGKLAIDCRCRGALGLPPLDIARDAVGSYVDSEIISEKTCEMFDSPFDSSRLRRPFA
jgi:hypothetical protein